MGEHGMTDMQINEAEKKVLVYLYLKYGMTPAPEGIGIVKEKVLGDMFFETALGPKGLISGGIKPRITEEGLKVIKEIIDE